jgi:CzcA family heavy metal efflux pump
MKVDVLPDINKPTVSVLAEAEGLAPEEVERLVLTPLEAAVSGAPGVERVRGTASFGLAIVNAEFGFGSDVFRNRQIIQERISRVELPGEIRPVLGPVGSVMGEIMWAGLTSEQPDADPMQLRTLADWTVRPALLRVPGVSDVIVLGGDVREWQINLNAEQMRRHDLHIEDITEKVGSALNNKSGGLLVQGGKEYPLRILIAPEEITELAAIAVAGEDEAPVRLADVAEIKEGPSPVRGSAAIDGRPGVILRVAKQPDAETLEVTAAVDEALEVLQASLPAGVELKTDLFRQEDFIHSGLENVLEALRDGTILVVIILVLFLMNARVTAITLTAIPLSILVTAIVFRGFGLSVNVMTLGGLAVAIGELVDDAIVDVENVFRRLRDWRATGMREPIRDIVFAASSEVRNSIVYATVLVGVVFLPIFFIPGVEGRLLSALGAAYLISLVASLIVSLSVTPVLASLLLKGGGGKSHEEETRFVRFIKRGMEPAIVWSVRHSTAMMAGTTAALLLAGFLYVSAGKEGIPPFNEGSATISVVLPVGTDIDTSNQFASQVETALARVEGVKRVSHLTGRAGADPHDSGANTSEVQVVFEEGLEGESERLFGELQEELNKIPGADYSLGQPITHRVEELLSGVRAPIVIKVFGDDLAALRATADQVRAELAKQPGVENPQVQREVLVPEFRIYPDANRLAESGVSSGEVAEELEEGLLGAQVGQVQIGPARVDVVARYDPESQGSSDALRDLALPFPGAESLGAAADIRLDGGRNRFSHEGGKRTLVVSANYQGGDIVGAVDTVKNTMSAQRLPTGQSISYEGTYKSQKENSRRLSILFTLGLILIFGILYHAFKAAPLVLQIMLNIPTVFIGGVIGVWLTGGVLNLAHLVGFISLAGIVSRNGIMLIGRCLTLVRQEGGDASEDTVVRATLDRVVPVLMTSLVTSLALIPLILAGGEPGKELLNPLAVVIFGGLISSTAISLFLTPAVFYRYGMKSALKSRVDASGF